VAYGENTGHQVLRIEGIYYAVDNGVWFTSKDAMGPWAVADSVPEEEIDKIPAESPVYNVKYVTVYESTPEVVYVGYTPGYMWTYPYYGVPVYGTGWYYPPYWGPVYYPRPVTYGFHMTYNPWTGWGFGMTVSSGFLTVGIAFGGYGGYYHGYHGGYYPPGGYRPPHNCFNCDINIGNNVGNRPSTRPSGGTGNNLYGGRGGGTSAAARPSQLPASSGNRTAKGPNNVYADRDGNVYRRDANGGWQSRESGGWSNTPSTSDRQRPSTGASPSTRPSPSGMERDYQARQRGATRSAPTMRSGGGGGRRR
jgi:hypothetical protein